MFIKVQRQMRHLSQEQLAEKCRLSLRTIQRVESGHRVGYSSLRALALFFEMDIDELEQELYSMDKIITEYKDYPLWVRLIMGSGWFSATRRELQKVEIFFAVFAFSLFVVWVCSFIWDFGPGPLPMIKDFGNFMGFAGVTQLFGAYLMSTTIRVGDKYDVWSKLESTQPGGLFGFFRKSKGKTP